eukprot:scaffold5725_cov387-Prasinococcus_capsulatus_cf.AAC.2
MSWICLARYQDVVELEVSMDNSTLVQGCDGDHELLEVHLPLRLRKRSLGFQSLRQKVVQVSAINVLGQDCHVLHVRASALALVYEVGHAKPCAAGVVRLQKILHLRTPVHALKREEPGGGHAGPQLHTSL